MLAFIKWVLLAICNVLPDSPFQQSIDSLNFDQSFLEYLNWFLPIDIAGNIFVGWIACIIAYIVFRLIYKIVVQLLLNKFLACIAALGSFI